MDDAKQPIQTASTARQWDKNLIFFVLNDEIRRKVLRELAQRGPKPANELSGGVARTPDVVLKHLVTLRTAGLITMHPNPSDRRRSIYALSPDFPMTTTPEGKVVDFGFCILRLDQL